MGTYALTNRGRNNKKKKEKITREKTLTRRPKFDFHTYLTTLMEFGRLSEEELSRAYNLKVAKIQNRFGRNRIM